MRGVKYSRGGLKNFCTQFFRPKVKENKTLTKKDYDRKHLSTSYTTDEWSDGGKKHVLIGLKSQ